MLQLSKIIRLTLLLSNSLIELAKPAQLPSDSGKFAITKVFFTILSKTCNVNSKFLLQDKKYSVRGST